PLRSTSRRTTCGSSSPSGTSTLRPQRLTVWTSCPARVWTLSTEYQKALGRKIAFHRKRRGLSQKEFAGLLARSEAWVSQVERGVRRIDRMTVLEKVAEVLEVPIAELAAEAPIVASVAEGEAPGASRLRLVLSSAHSLMAILGQQDVSPDVPAL